MKRIVLLLSLLLLHRFTFAQKGQILGSGRPSDTCIALGALRTEGLVKFPYYVISDTNKVLSIAEDGTFVFRTKQNHFTLDNVLGYGNSSGNTIEIAAGGATTYIEPGDIVIQGNSTHAGFLANGSGQTHVNGLSIVYPDSSVTHTGAPRAEIYFTGSSTIHDTLYHSGKLATLHDVDSMARNTAPASPSVLTSMIWNGTTDGAYKMFTMSGDSTLTLIDSVNGQEMYLRVVCDSSILKVKINTDSVCYQTAGSGVSYLAFKNWLGTVDDIIPSSWTRIACPVPSGPTILSFAGGLSGPSDVDLSGINDYAFLNGGSSPVDAFVTTAGTANHLKIYLGYVTGLNLCVRVLRPATSSTQTLVHKWSFSSGFTANSVNDFDISADNISLEVGDIIQVEWHISGSIGVNSVVYLKSSTGQTSKIIAGVTDCNTLNTWGSGIYGDPTTWTYAFYLPIQFEQ
jgi:hypothetical protein